MVKRHRRLKSVADELVRKSREAALASVQIYNNPTIQFKAELFIVTMHIAWTYLLHAYYRRKEIDYRYGKVVNARKRFDRTKGGAFKHWELERCLDHEACPLDEGSKRNLRFLIGIRHEIEHQMTSRIDDSLSAKFQASCLNFNNQIRTLFGEHYGIDRYLAFSLQFSSISPEQKKQLISVTNLPAHIESYISGFENQLTEDQYADTRYAYRVIFVEKTANRKNQADKVIEFVKGDSDIAKSTNAEYERVLLKEIDKKKYMAKDVVAKMKSEGHSRFEMVHHTNLWKGLDGKNPGKGYAGQLGTQWYWFDSWLHVVRKHCEENRSLYSSKA
jgi:hypothetical protein